ncbi:MAG: hypothetical protein ACTSPN_08065 [Promethearchaeota archaeon]
MPKINISSKKMVEKQKSIIGLITDFGLHGSHYVASMKGVILKINPL